MPTINRGDDYFAVVTYTGNGSSQSITGLRFQPDFVWIKGRSGATDHALYDAQRGVQKRLESNTTDAEATSDNGVTAFNSDGFSIGSLAQVNTNGATYVAWCWKESATAGFDIVTTTMNASGSTTINHSLGVTPSFVITKNRNGTVAWNVYSTVLGTNQYLQLNATIAATTLSDFWGSPTSTQFTFGSPFANTGTYVAYLFAEVAGFSRFGSYTGNGSSDGPFVFCGFRPRWVMIKRTDSTQNWQIFDTSRDTFNVSQNSLFPNLSNAETSGYAIDVLSNGFKIRETGTNSNASGGTYIFASFAENPFKNALAR